MLSQYLVVLQPIGQFPRMFYVLARSKTGAVRHVFSAHEDLFTQLDPYGAVRRVDYTVYTIPHVDPNLPFGGLVVEIRE